MQVIDTSKEIILAKWQKRKPSFNALKNKKRYNQVEKANINYALPVLTRFQHIESTLHLALVAYVVNEKH